MNDKKTAHTQDKIQNETIPKRKIHIMFNLKT